MRAPNVRFKTMNWKHPYEFLKIKTEEILVGEGFVLDQEQLNPDVFGSAYCIYKHQNGTSLRLIWDGKDGWGYIQIHDNNDWKDVSVYITEGDIESKQIKKRKINQFQDQIKSIIE
jgi:hypothetical protein